MRINSDYKIREIAGESIVVNQGTPDVDMTHIISLNSSARLLYEALSDKEFTVEDAACILVNTYGIAEDAAVNDAKKWVDALIKCKIINGV